MQSRQRAAHKPGGSAGCFAAGRGVEQHSPAGVGTVTPWSEFAATQPGSKQPLAVSFNSQASQICLANPGWKYHQLPALARTEALQDSLPCSRRVVAMLCCRQITVKAAPSNSADGPLLLGRNRVALRMLVCNLCGTSLQCCRVMPYQACPSISSKLPAPT